MKNHHENILIYGISYKTLTGSRPLFIRFDKIHGFIRIYDWTRNLKLLGSEKYDAIYDGIRYCKSKKWHHIYFFSLFCKNQSWFLWFFAYRRNVDFT